MLSPRQIEKVYLDSVGIYTEADKHNLMSRSEKVVIIVYFVGVALIITGQSVYRYANQRISDLETKLSPGLSVYEYGMIKGSLDWWRPALISIFGPISIYLITAGIATLAFLAAYIALAMRRSKRKR